MKLKFTFIFIFGLFLPLAAHAQERPSFVTYNHHMEEPGSLEVGLNPLFGTQRGGGSFLGAGVELEYGVKGWWTMELYLDGQATRGQGSAFTGWRWENRFRPFKGEHRLNPILYVEYESINEASRIQKEIVGSGRLDFEPLSELREAHANELEAKLILSSTFGRWNVAENFTAEKNLSQEEGIEFGYSVGVSRPYKKIAAGVEVYGGAGSTLGFDGGEQRHYLAPVFSWHVAPGTLKVSVAAGLTSASDHVLFRVGYSLEFHPRD